MDENASRQSNLFQITSTVNILVFFSLLAAGAYTYFSSHLVSNAFKGPASSLGIVHDYESTEKELQNGIALAIATQSPGGLLALDSLNKDWQTKSQNLSQIKSSALQTKISEHSQNVLPELTKNRTQVLALLKSGQYATAGQSLSDKKTKSLQTAQNAFVAELTQAAQTAAKDAAGNAGYNQILAYVMYGLTVLSVGGILVMFVYSRRLQREIDASFESLEKSQFGAKRQEGMLAAVVNSSTDAILLVDKKLKVVMMNDELIELYKHDEKKPEVGAQALSLVPPEEIEYYNILYNRALKGESFTKNEEKKVGNRVVHLEVSYFPVKAKDRSIVGACAISRNITERIEEEREKEKHQREMVEVNRKLRDSEDKLKSNIHELEVTQLEMQRVQDELAYSKALMDSVFQNADVMISATNLTGQMIVWNRKSEEQLGFTASEAINGGLTPMQIIDQGEIEYEAKRLSKEYKTNIQPNFETLSYLPFKNETYKKEWTFVRKNGQRFPVELFITGLTDKENQFIGVVNIAQDITERLQQQSEILQANKNLLESKEELQKALDELKSAQNNLVQAEKMASLGQLVAGVAHEVNTPIGIAVTAASYLDKSTHEFNNALAAGQLRKSELLEYMNQATESSQMILKNLGRAAELIQSFKKVAVDQSKEDINIITLKHFIVDIMISLTAELRKSKITYEIEGPEDLQIKSMVSSLSQVFINFVMNSIRHAFDEWDGERKLAITFRKEGANKVAIVFADTGKGIPAEVLPKIFDPFFTTKRGKGGSGLGLHIVYNIVKQKLNGDIICKSEVNKGAAFTIILPVSI